MEQIPPRATSSGFFGAFGVRREQLGSGRRRREQPEGRKERDRPFKDGGRLPRVSSLPRPAVLPRPPLLLPSFLPRCGRRERELLPPPSGLLKSTLKGVAGVTRRTDLKLNLSPKEEISTSLLLRDQVRRFTKVFVQFCPYHWITLISIVAEKAH